MTDAELDLSIADLEALLNSGVKATTADGLSQTYDLEAARHRLAELRALRRKRAGKKTRHPWATPTFGGACE